MNRHRVVITGVGVKAPGGTSVPQLLSTVLAGRSVAAPVPELLERGAPVTFACRVPDFDLTEYLPRHESRKLDRTAHLCLSAALDAVNDAGLRAAVPCDPMRAGVSVGTGVGGLGAAENIAPTYGERMSDIPVFTVTRLMANAAAAQIAMLTGFRGSANTYSTACASGATAIGEATNKIRYGEWDVAIAGGGDAPIKALIVAGFHRTKAMSGNNADPAGAARPFDDTRDGFVMGEGAAFVVLERWDLATDRGATILGEVSGYAANCDAYHLVAPSPDAEATIRCARDALADADLKPSDIGHVNAHGTGTLLNDRAEAHTLREVFGAACPPVTAPKGVTGHLLGGAGAVEAILALSFAREGLVPPTANFTCGADADGLDLVTGEARRIATQPALSNSFGFGGHNVCLVLSPTT